MTIMTRTLLSLLVLTAIAPAQEPLRQASVARLWLKVPSGQPPLRDVRVSNGSAKSAAWEKDAATRDRLTDVVFPVRWWAWNTTTITFTPPYDGPLEITLSGAWEQDSNKSLIRQEILWDDLTAEGTSLRNGGFEKVLDGRPEGWQAPWAPYPAPEAWPLANAAPLTGKLLAATWHNRPLSQTVQLKSGVPVTLKVHARAATPPDFIEPKRLGNDTPAHRAMARLKRGVNLGNGWEAPPPYTWGIRFTTDDIDRIAAEGFDHIRVPVAWHYHLKPDNNQGWDISPTLLADLEPVLRRALEKKLHVLINWHHFDDLTNNPAANAGRFTAGWDAIARHFKSWPPGLFFELLNEPCHALTTTAANPIYQKTIAAIRAVDPQRVIVASPGNWGQVGELDKLRLPDNDDRIIVTVHCYEPFYFTHQGANWVQLQALRGIVYPGPPAQPCLVPEALQQNAGVRSFIDGYNTLPADQNPCSARSIKETLDCAREWSDHFGRPVHLGEFGSHNIADIASRLRYLKDVRSLAEARKISWALWEWKASFGYWDPKTNQPILRRGLFD